MDTIAAPATATGGGVGIVRVSGPNSRAIARAIMRPWPAEPETHKLYYGRVFRGEHAIDDALGVLMVAPHSYTGEDVFEIHGHGGELVLHQLLEATLAAGARVAEPGEFTRRAFENGRMSLDQAEAVATIIGARSERSLRAAQALRHGALGDALAALKGSVVGVLAEIEGVLDFPDEQLTAASQTALADTLQAAAHSLGEFTAKRGQWLERVPTVVLYGSVNAGKSSLFNRLAGAERALVDAEPGTTRDAVEAEIDLCGVKVRLIDTAGERADAGRIEQKGLEIGRRAREAASVAVFVVDGSRADSPLMFDGSPILVWNKSDLAVSEPRGWEGRTIRTSALHGRGIDELRDAIADALGIRDVDSRDLMVLERHREALAIAKSKIEQAGDLLMSGAPIEICALELREGMQAIDRVTGETVDGAVLDAIFSRFCIGK